MSTMVCCEMTGSGCGKGITDGVPAQPGRWHPAWPVWGGTVLTLPHITTARTRLTVLPPERAELMLDFYRRNRTHLQPWEP